MRAETAALVSETLENIARTQRVTIHSCLFLFQEKVIFFLKAACNHYFKKIVLNLINQQNKVPQTLTTENKSTGIPVCTCGLPFLFISVIPPVITERFYLFPVHGSQRKTKLI